MFYRKVNDNINLKLLTTRNAEELFSLIEESRRELAEWLPWIEGKSSVNDCIDSIEKWGKRYIEDTAINAGIFYKGKLSGMIAFPNINWSTKSTSFGYWLSPKFEGNGIMVKSVSAMLSYAFNEFNINRIEISCAENNLKSRALPDKLGFKQEGILRDNYALNGKLYNLVVYSLLAAEWEK